ncbi:ArnT family glycosyltransferase [Gandjariella thermophila]|uniref:Glycosyltransferase RgtA/B/C/D-like domain-containing protein n=1 Tax=Gandjariella thermophila TaxID=1931992 RepID=A0A4D4J4Y6_9PSEU|nr:glycosyltransferase family 39 protein [Gandjariella thermophila]GDY29023.1 hypothetical protein GTS_06560 [Gandjariella thermophila]
MPHGSLPAWFRAAADGGALATRPPSAVAARHPAPTAERPVAVSRAPVSWSAVLPAAVGVLAVLVALSPWYGYYRDELYFRILAAHPGWGYVDTPPLTPLLARAGIWLFGDTVTAVRIPAALCTAVTVVLAALIAAEFGGRRRAQVFAALGTATGMYPLLVGHTLLTNSADLVAWCAVWLFATRALLRGDGRWWLAAGVAVGLAVYDKHLVLLPAIGILAGLAAAGPRRLLLDRRLLVGVALALLIGLPNLLYQAAHDWPQLRMAGAMAAQSGGRNRLLALPGQLALIGVPLVPVWLAGLIGLLRDPRWRAVRALGVAHPVVVAVVMLTDGRIDYAAGTLVPLLAVGCVRLEAWFARPAGRRRMVVAVTANAALSTLFVLPVLPVDLLGRTPVPLVNPEARDGVGWPQLVAQVAAVYQGLPPDERSGAAVLTNDYGEAGAVDRYGGEHHLPPAYSGHNELARWLPPESANAVVAVGIAPERLAAAFDRCTVAGRVDLGAAVRSDEQGVPITVCDGRHLPWAAVWPRLANLH